MMPSKAGLQGRKAVSEMARRNVIGDVWTSVPECDEIAIFGGFAFVCIGLTNPDDGEFISTGSMINTNEMHGHWIFVGNVTPCQLCDVILTAAESEVGDE